MQPLTQPMAIVSVTTDPRRAEPCIESWLQTATTRWPIAIVEHGVVHNTPLASVQAFAEGVERALRFKPHADLIACFSERLVILEDGWDQIVSERFHRDPAVALVSFGGLSALDLDTDALVAVGIEKGAGAGLIAAPAGWCAIGRRSFWSGFAEEEVRTGFTRRKHFPRPWAVCLDAGLTEYGIGEALGCCARRRDWGVWYQPIRHRLVATPTAAYERWAEEHFEGGDRGFSEIASRIIRHTFAAQLPLRLAPAGSGGGA